MTLSSGDIPAETNASSLGGELARSPHALANSPVLPAPSESRRAGTTASFETRIAETETELVRLSQQLSELKREWEQEAASEVREQFEALREAVLRYSFACAEVDMRLALISARADKTGEATENLRRSLEEQTAASDHLRNLARSLN